MKKRKTLAKKVILCVTIGFLLTASMSTVTYADGFDENAEESEAVLRSSSKEVITDTTGEWKSWEGRWWYEYPDGSCIKDAWLFIGEKYYYFDDEGWMVTGWLQLDSVWYYLADNGCRASGLFKVGETWYYSDLDGVMQTGWIHLNDGWHYFYEGGSMAVGWLQIGETKYYTDANGVMQTGWQNIDGNYYYFYEGGSCLLYTSRSPRDRQKSRMPSSA